MTPTTQDAKELKTLFEEARTLANFSNLDSEGAADYFRAKYPGFVPPSVWGSQHITLSTSEPRTQRSLPTWTNVRDEVRRAWISRFPPAQCLYLITEIVDLDRTGQVMNFLMEQLATLKEYEIKPESVLPQTKIYGFQRAVMFLAVNPWRARFCDVCRNRFIAAESKQRLCSGSCRQNAQANRQAAYWKRSGKEQRRIRQKQELRHKSKNQRKES